MSGGGDRFNFENQPDTSASANATSIQGVSVPPPTVDDTYLRFKAGVLAWVALPSAAPETAGSALAVGTSVYRSSANKMLTEDGTYAALKDAFAGFATSAAAVNGDPVSVAGNGQRATGLTSIIVGTGYYVSANVLIPESGIAAFVSSAASGIAYRFVGTGDTTTSIKQAWGETQQVP